VAGFGWLCAEARFSFVIFVMSVLPFWGELTVSSPLFIVFSWWNKLRFHFTVGRTIDKTFWYLQKPLQGGEVTVKSHRVPDLLL
jgi:hypothetical protein